MADQGGLEGSQPVDLKKHPSGIVPTLQWVPIFFVLFNYTYRSSSLASLSVKSRKHKIQIRANCCKMPKRMMLSLRWCELWVWGCYNGLVYLVRWMYGRLSDVIGRVLNDEMLCRPNVGQLFFTAMYSLKIYFLVIDIFWTDGGHVNYIYLKGLVTKVYI